MDEREKKRDFGAQSCRVSQSVWFKYLSTFPEGEYSGHSWSSIMPDIHSHCQRRQTDWAVLRLIPAVVQPTEINRQPSSDAPQIVSYSTHHTGLFTASPILIHFHCYKIIIPPSCFGNLHHQPAQTLVVDSKMHIRWCVSYKEQPYTLFFMINATVIDLAAQFLCCISAAIC